MDQGRYLYRAKSMTRKIHFYPRQILFLQIISFLCALLFLCLCMTSSVRAQNFEVPDWQLYNDGDAYEQIWAFIPEQEGEIMEGIGVARPIIGIAVVELDGDPGPEVLAYVPKDYNLYTFDDPGDPFYVFDVDSRGRLVLLAEFRAFGMFVANSVTNGMRDLMVMHQYEGSNYVLYRWSAQRQAYLPGYSGRLPANWD